MGMDFAEFIVGGLFLIFIGLKLAGILHWSWWWVLSPLWVPFAAVILIMIFVSLILASAWLVIKIIEALR